MPRRTDSVVAPSSRITLDFAGVGIGPANLSLAALAHPRGSLRFRCFERKEAFDWHPGLMLPGSSIQVSFLKDLVSLVDPTNPYSFLNFLATQRRLYNFITADFPQVLRAEYEQYYRWVATSIPGLCFGEEVGRVSFEEHTDSFHVETQGGEYRAHHVVLGTGRLPNVPECANAHLGDKVFHASRFLVVNPDLSGKRVALIGGGQTAAELALHLLQSDPRIARLDWYTRRHTLLPLDDSAFTNEFFLPAYSDYFFGLPAGRRAALLKEHNLASDGISPGLLLDLYRRFYELRHIRGDAMRFALVPGTELVGIRPAWRGWSMAMRRIDDGLEFEGLADIIILCTGYRNGFQSCVKPLTDRFVTREDGFFIRDDFSAAWHGPSQHRIFVQSGARHVRGVAEPNLSLMPWRSAKILNGIAGRPLYALDDGATMATWFPQERVGITEAAHG